MNISSEVREATKAEALRLVNERLSLSGIQPQHTQCYDTDEVFDDIETGCEDDEEDISYDGDDNLDFLEEDDEIEEIDEKLENTGVKIIQMPIRGYRQSNPISQEQINKVADESMQGYNKAQRALHNNGFNQAFTTDDILRKLAQQRAEKEKVVDKDPDVFYTIGNYNFCGKQVKSTRATTTLNLEKYKNEFREGDLEGNYKSLCNLITFEVLRNFPNAHTIAVSDNALIINGTCFQPNIDDNSVKFPLDSIQYIRSGCIAPFFDWSSCIICY